MKSSKNNITLCLDVGNSHIFGGLFEGHQLKLRFRYATTLNNTSDQLGVFLKTMLKENNYKKRIHKIHISSVVPSLDYSLRSACIKYFKIDPVLVRFDLKSNLKIAINNPKELGADLIANSLAAIKKYPKKNIILVDMGTATTISVINHKQEYMGVAILPGMKLSMDALHINTAKLFAVEITESPDVIGKNTAACIQSGLYFGQLGVIREISTRVTAEYFQHKKPIIIGTGGFSYLFEKENIFTVILPDLILEGLRDLVP
jgi:type III pantothenate kinase